MKRSIRKTTSIVLVLMLLFGATSVLQLTASAIDISGDIVIREGGEYQLTPGASEITITVETKAAVTITGNGIGEYATPNSWVYIDCSGETGVDLRLQNVYLSNDSNNAEQGSGSVYNNIINFSGTGNKLYILGENIIDQNLNASGKAAIHVGSGSGLTLLGTGKLYLYKHEQGAGIGGDINERGGAITFNGPTVFAKGSKQGAVIGTGANDSGSLAGMPSGDITISSGAIYIVTNARAAAIGGGAGSSAVPGGNVYIDGGTLTINVDFSGAAIGGGGYNGGNDSLGGTAFFGSTSVKTYIDENAVIYWQNNGHDATARGVNGNMAITAAKTNGSAPVYLLVLDTDDLVSAGNGYYQVKEGASTVYEGGLHHYKYAYEHINRAIPGSVETIDTNESYTPNNWIPSGDTNLYLYLTGENHTLTVNGETVEVRWENGELVVAAAEPERALGDVNGDGIINVTDGLLVMQYAAKLIGLTPEGLAAADVNRDGIVNVSDGLLIMQYAAKLITEFN